MDLFYFVVVFGGGGDVGIIGFYDLFIVQLVVFIFIYVVKYYVCYFFVIFVG